MILLITYVLVALVFSFLCSIAEAVLLSVTTAYITVLEKDKKNAGIILRELKSDINKPLAAILTLNTIAHTTGAVGAGAQAATVFGSAYVGVASAILTLLILILSEIIPKTLGATYWRNLAPVTARGVKFITWLLFPFVWLSEKITSGMVKESSLTGFSREEISAIAEIGAEEGAIAADEFKVLRNLLSFNQTCIKESMTPRTVLFSLSGNLTVEEFFHKYDKAPFSRILTYTGDKDNIDGFVIRSDLLLAHARGNSKNRLKNYRRSLNALLDKTSLSHALNEMQRMRSQILLVVDEYGSVQGIVTIEDLIESLLGLEIVDERDKTVDMQKLAKKNWIQKMKKKGFNVNQ